MKLPRKIIDANVILRFLLDDDTEQFIKSKIFMQRLETFHEEALLTEIVFAEIVWVLNKVYNVPRKDISESLLQIINYKGIKTVFDKKIFIDSLKLYAELPIDIQDIFLSVIAINNNCSVMTFDKKDFNKLHCSFSEP